MPAKKFETIFIKCIKRSGTTNEKEKNLNTTDKNAVTKRTG